MKNAVIVLAILAALIVNGASGYVVVTTAQASNYAISNADTVLESVRTHANSAYQSLSSPPTVDTSGTNPDFAKARDAIDGYAAQLDDARATVQSDELRLRAVRDQLSGQRSNVLALPWRNSLDHQRSRVQSMLSALDAEDSALQIVQSQMQALSAVFDAFTDFIDVGSKLQAQDLAGALAVFPSLDGKLQTAARLVSGSNNPPQLQKAITSLQTLSADLNATVQAIQRRDIVGLLGLEAKLETDSTAFQSFDDAGLQASERTLIQPYQDRYNAGVRAAGFTLTN